MRIVALQARLRAAILVDTSVVDTSVVMRSGGQVVLLVTTKTDYSGIHQQELGINGSVMMVTEGAGVDRDRAVKERRLAYQFPVAGQAQTLFRRALRLTILQAMARAAAIVTIGRMSVVNRPSPGACFGILTTWANDRVRFHRVSRGGLGAGLRNAVEEESQDAVPNARRAG